MKAPASARVEHIGPQRTLGEMLETGELNVLYSTVSPPSFRTGSPNAQRLFPDAEACELRYFQDTGIFPIMHALVIRRRLYEKNRWLAEALFAAFSEAKDRVQTYYARTATVCTVS